MMPAPNDPRWAIPVLLASVALLVIIVVAHQQPVPAPRMGRHEPIPDGAHIHVPAESPCTLDRVQLACDRWAAHGWPRCVAQPTGGRLRVVVYDGEERGAAGDGVVGISPGACGSADLTLEHELGHAAYDLAHVGLSGTVMTSEVARQGARFPEAP